MVRGRCVVESYSKVHFLPTHMCLGCKDRVTPRCHVTLYTLTLSNNPFLILPLSLPLPFSSFLPPFFPLPLLPFSLPLPPLLLPSVLCFRLRKKGGDRYIKTVRYAPVSQREVSQWFMRIHTFANLFSVSLAGPGFCVITRKLRPYF